MKLSYRGHTYSYHPSVVEGDEVLVSGRYRGNRATIHVHRNLPVRHLAELTYRGVKFSARS
ncbi:MAG: DUF4278 domain-containing protein [Cyanophyceae cyanobacterium]